LIMPIGAVLSPLPLASLLLSTVYPCVWGSHTLHIPRGGLLLGGGVPNLLGTSVRGKIHAFCRTSTGRYRQYTTDEAVRRTRFGSRYRLQEEEVDEPIYNARLSIKCEGSGETILFHSSWVIKPPPIPSQHSTLRARINRQENQSLWTNLNMDEDGEWLYDALIGGTLKISHDGSYMNDLARDVCACGVVFHCTRTNKYADLTWAERSTPQIATNYRGEILGGQGPGRQKISRRLHSSANRMRQYGGSKARPDSTTPTTGETSTS